MINPNLLRGHCLQCERPMRDRGVLKHEAPETQAYGHSGHCKSCVQPNTPERKALVANKTGGRRHPLSKEAIEANTLAGLQAFLGARHRRGVTKETGSVADLHVVQPFAYIPGPAIQTVPAPQEQIAA